MSRSTMPIIATLVSLLAPSQALAFCRATTCDPTASLCSPDASGCARDGYAVFWESDCVTVSVEGTAAPAAGIDYDALRGSVERAFETWTSVECPGGGHPSLHVEVQGPIDCSMSEYNNKKGNANVVILRGDSWPYRGKSPDALGYTRLRFDLDSGALFDADIELNAVDEPLAVGRTPRANEVDLDAVLTHEAGHLLGLNHSTDTEAAMRPGNIKGSTAMRTPSTDDIEGICKIYPPDRKLSSRSCEPRHGFSALCGADQPEVPAPGDPPAEASTSSGCALTGASRDRSAWPLLVVAALVCTRRPRPHLQAETTFPMSAQRAPRLFSIRARLLTLWRRARADIWGRWSARRRQLRSARFTSPQHPAEDAPVGAAQS